MDLPPDESRQGSKLNSITGDSDTGRLESFSEFPLPTDEGPIHPNDDVANPIPKQPHPQIGPEIHINETSPVHLTTQHLRNGNQDGTSRPGFPAGTAESQSFRSPTYRTHRTPGSQSFSLETSTSTDEEPHLPRHFHRSGSQSRHPAPDPNAARRLHRFSVYETETRFYIVGGDVSDQTFRVLTIHRDSPQGQLTITEDAGVYSRTEMNNLLSTLDAGNAPSGGIKLRCSAWGLLGFLRFTTAFYMLLVTKRTQVALIGGHMIYQVDGTELIPVVTDAETQRLHKDRTPHESRYLNILGNLNLNQNFYFSYAYNISQTLQNNIAFLRSNGSVDNRRNLDDMFVWNHHLLEPVKQIMENPLDWCLTLTHGFVGQSVLEVVGRRIYITVIARRSRLYAGARFLKRGVNDSGYVANDVETEQIVSDMMTTSFHSPNGRLYANPRYTSYVQHRGSIPLFWEQDNSGVSPKPGIKLTVGDPFYHAAALHFDNLFERYGTPIYVLNLVKAREKAPRESILLVEYETAIRYLNQSLPEAHKILYRAFDMSRASKAQGQNVVETLEVIAEDVLDKTGFFINSDDKHQPGSSQNGVARTNCIDCLDRTNAAQFVIAKCALGRQLKALGVLKESKLEYETDAVNIFSLIFHDHGDTIATQYGGSCLVNTMATYRKINQWQSSSRDMVESFKRYYNNSFKDAQRQKAYNLFLGNYVYIPGQPMLWELPTDYYLHQTTAVGWDGMRRRHYIHWYTPRFLVQRTIPPPLRPNDLTLPADRLDDFWNEYYRPLSLSSLAKLYAFRINTHNRYVRAVMHTSHSGSSGRRYRAGNSSPFKVRQKPGSSHHPTQPGSGSKGAEKKAAKTQTFISSLWPLSGRRESARIKGIAEETSRKENTVKFSTVSNNQLQNEANIASNHPSNGDVNSGSGNNMNISSSGDVVDRTKNHQWSLTEFYHNSLDPAVSTSEADEYRQYIEFPQNMPLIMDERPPDDTEVYELLDQSKAEDASNSLLDYVTYLKMVSMQTKPMDLPSIDWPGDGDPNDVTPEGSQLSDDEESGTSIYSHDGGPDDLLASTSTITPFSRRLKSRRSTISQQVVSQDQPPTSIPASTPRQQGRRMHSPPITSHSGIVNDRSSSKKKGRTTTHSRRQSIVSTTNQSSTSHSRSQSNRRASYPNEGADSSLSSSLITIEGTHPPGVSISSHKHGALGLRLGLSDGRSLQEQPSDLIYRRQEQHGAYDTLTTTDPDLTTLQYYQDFIKLPHDSKFLNDYSYGSYGAPSWISAKLNLPRMSAIMSRTNTSITLDDSQNSRSHEHHRVSATPGGHDGSVPGNPRQDRDRMLDSSNQIYDEPKSAGVIADGDDPTTSTTLPGVDADANFENRPLTVTLPSPSAFPELAVEEEQPVTGLSKGSFGPVSASESRILGGSIIPSPAGSSTNHSLRSPIKQQQNLDPIKEPPQTEDPHFDISRTSPHHYIDDNTRETQTQEHHHQQQYPQDHDPEPQHHRHRPPSSAPSPVKASRRGLKSPATIAAEAKAAEAAAVAAASLAKDHHQISNAGGAGWQGESRSGYRAYYNWMKGQNFFDIGRER